MTKSFHFRSLGAVPSWLRTGIVALSFAGVLAGCQTVGTYHPALVAGLDFGPDMYTARLDEDFELPAIRTGGTPRKFQRQVVAYETEEKPGTLIVDTPNKFLYLVLPRGKAIRYGIGVGKAGFSWSGSAKVAWKQKWPKWTPPKEMIQRQPRLKKYEDGMDPGLDNPLGARALYIFEDGKDTLYRIHGTNQQNSIGRAVSSGCIRLWNQDVIDLYNRVQPGAKIVVIPDPRTHLAQS
ncbi:L,D-transpeptidase [Rhodobium gokarnense]|uniref:Lipoprotein-anchoring transpeptidase ErfK/SrfK n=1 Tax=Rhodobium gokarnense TaxID=364296 RepID=A0ABT3HGV6_9HYPH|nr:lipoprotein-anchoring transpeptidase ErfK/SrfK [Rhodobium gokarnense]